MLLSLEKRWAACGADKRSIRIQDTLMHIECPHCLAGYDLEMDRDVDSEAELDSDIAERIVVCHRCGEEIDVHAVSVGGLPERDGGAFDWDDTCQKNALPIDSLAPQRNNTRIWPWFLTMLILLAGVGFQIQHDAWMDNRWFRSALINIGFDLDMRAKDWRIAPQSVHPKWIKRSDGSRVLFVRGRIENLLSSDMPLPRIAITFFSNIDPQKQLARIVAVIRRMPSEQAIAQVPMVLPAMDNSIVPALAKHDFAVLVESTPAASGDFTVMPAVH